MTTPTKLPFYKKWYLKYTNRPAYKAYKQSLHVQGVMSDNDHFKNKASTLNHPKFPLIEKPVINIKHSGNSGDIIYAIPAMLALAGKGTINLYLHSNQPGQYENFHPLGNVMLNDGMIARLQPLIEYQPKINFCKPYNGEALDYDFDLFRQYNFDLTSGSISRWYFNVFAVFYDLCQPWLQVPVNDELSDTILVARSHRYRNPGITYDFLKKYPKVSFIGVPEEFKDIQQYVPNIEYRPIKDFLEMASLIKGAKLFIGNQSFPFSMAEGLKANRLLEVYYRAPNVVVEGPYARDFLYQPQFEFIVQSIMGY